MRDTPERSFASTIHSCIEVENRTQGTAVRRETNLDHLLPRRVSLALVSSLNSLGLLGGRSDLRLLDTSRLRSLGGCLLLGSLLLRGLL